MDSVMDVNGTPMFPTVFAPSISPTSVVVVVLPFVPVIALQLADYGYVQAGRFKDKS
jgi:hypothetical protein